MTSGGSAIFRALAAVAVIAVAVVVFRAARALPDADALGPGVEGEGRAEGSRESRSLPAISRPEAPRSSPSAVQQEPSSSRGASPSSNRVHALPVRGRVLDVSSPTAEDSELDGLPLAGVPVRLVVVPDDDERGLRIEAECVTDARGLYSWTFQIPDAWRTEDTFDISVCASASLAGFVPAEEWEGADLQYWSEEWDPVEDGERVLELDLWLELGGVLTGRVFDASGLPAMSADVTLTDGDQRWTADTDRDGRYSIEFEDPGSYSLCARQSEKGTAWLPTLYVTTDAENVAPNLVLHGPASISGKVTDPKGVPLSGIRVGAIAVEALESNTLVGGERGLIRLARSGSTSLERDAGLLSNYTTAVRGQFELSGMQSGRYQVFAWVERWRGGVPSDPQLLMGPVVSTPAVGVDLVLPLYRLEVRVGRVPALGSDVGGHGSTKIRCRELKSPRRELKSLEGWIGGDQRVARFQVNPGRAYVVGAGCERVGFGLQIFTVDSQPWQVLERAESGEGPPTEILWSSTKEVRIHEDSYLTVVELEWADEEELGVIELTVKDGDGAEEWRGRALLQVYSDGGAMHVGRRWIEGGGKSIAILPGLYHLELTVFSGQAASLVLGSYINVASISLPGQGTSSRPLILRRTVRVKSGEVIPLEFGITKGGQVLLELTGTEEGRLASLGMIGQLSSQLSWITSSGTRLPAGPFSRMELLDDGGATYLSDRMIEPGVYELEIRIPGCEPVSARVIVRAGEVAKARFALRRLSQSAPESPR